jgi:transcriptional regulator with XRE-family HTH domain
MLVRDHRKLARLMVIQNISVRQLSRIAGWNSHSYLARILRGEVKSLKTDPALRIAHALGVAVDDLFLVKVTSNTGHTDKQSPARVA